MSIKCALIIISIKECFSKLNEHKNHRAGDFSHTLCLLLSFLSVYIWDRSQMTSKYPPLILNLKR